MNALDATTDEDVEHVLERIKSLEREIGSLHTALLRRDRSEKAYEALIVDLGEIRAALEISRVVTVLPFCALGRVPSAPPWLLGTLDFHGEPLSVIDLAGRLGLVTSRPHVDDFLVVSNVANRRVALLVRGVRATKSVSLDTLNRQALPPSLAPYVVGTFPHQGETTYALSLSTLLRGEGGA